MLIPLEVSREVDETANDVSSSAYLFDQAMAQDYFYCFLSLATPIDISPLEVHLKADCRGCNDKELGLLSDVSV